MEQTVPPDEFLCPITQDVMIHPVMDREGHSFECKAILNWLLVNTKCPIGREKLAHTELSPNRALRSLIEKWSVAEGRDISSLSNSQARKECEVFTVKELIQEETNLKTQLEEMDAKGITPKFVVGKELQSCKVDWKAPPPTTRPPPSAYRGPPNHAGGPVNAPVRKATVVQGNARPTVSNPPPPSSVPPPVNTVHLPTRQTQSTSVDPINRPTSPTLSPRPPSGPPPPSAFRGSKPTGTITAPNPSPAPATPAHVRGPPPRPEKQFLYVKALYDYAARHEKDVSFKEGDLIRVIDKSNPAGWWEGEVNGVTGFFPSTFVESEERTFYAVALYDFVGRANRDLSFKVGDKIKVTDSSNPSGWWKGELMTGQTGFFPYTFVTPIPK